MFNDDVAPYQNVVVKEFTSSAVNEDWNLYFKFLYKFPTCLCSYCCYLLTIVVLLLFQNQKFNCNTIFTWMNYPACLVSLVLFVKLHLIIRLCNLSNEIIDNYSFQQKRVNCSKVSGYQQLIPARSIRLRNHTLLIAGGPTFDGSKKTTTGITGCFTTLDTP